MLKLFHPLKFYREISSKDEFFKSSEIQLNLDTESLKRVFIVLNIKIKKHVIISQENKRLEMELITLKQKLKEVDDINSTLSLELEMTKRQKSPSYIENGMVWKLYPVYNEHLSFRQCSKPN